MKTLSIVFIAIVLLSSIIGVATVVTKNTVADTTPYTLDSANIYRMVEATAMNKEHDTTYSNVRSMNIEVVYN